MGKAVVLCLNIATFWVIFVVHNRLFLPGGGFDIKKRAVPFAEGNIL